MFTGWRSFAESRNVDPIDSLRRELTARSSRDSVYVDLLNELSFAYLSNSTDTVLKYTERAQDLATRLGYKRGIATAYKNRGVADYLRGNLYLGLVQMMESLQIAEEIHDLRLIARLQHNIAGIYLDQENYELAFRYLDLAYATARSVEDTVSMATEELSLCHCLQKLGQANRAIHYCERSLPFLQRNRMNDRIAFAYLYLGDSYRLLKEPHSARLYLWKAKAYTERGSFNNVAGSLYRSLGDLYSDLGENDSSLFYYARTVTSLKVFENAVARRQLYRSMSTYWERGGAPDSALVYSKKYGDLVLKENQSRALDQISAVQAYRELNLNKKELHVSREEVERQTGIIVLIAAISVLLIISVIVILFLYRAKQKAHKEVRLMNANLEAAVAERTREIQQKNEILISYAHANAHSVRGPLARILGILHLIKLTGRDAEMQEYFDKLKENADELDSVVRGINQQLEENDSKDS
jgi:tetratricopeptide (TPR) repeat protein